MTSLPSQRRYEFDWLRIFAILIVFIYHSTRFFNLGDWHMKNIDTYVWVEVWNIFVTRWMMPLFFIISGASLFYAMVKSKGFKHFYSDKFLRLFIPVLVASVTHGAILVYLEKLSHGRLSGSFFEFIPDYFNGVYTGIGLSGSGNFANVGMHLWYLLFLFIYSLICYRLFVWFKAGGRNLLNRLTSLAAIPIFLYPAFTIPLIIMKALIPHSILDVGNGGWGFLYYLWFLIAGFIIVSSDQLQRSIKNWRWVSLFLGLVISVVYLYLLFGVSAPVLRGRSGDWISSLFSFFSAWSWIFAILGFGLQHLAFNRPILSQLNEGVLPFFILHQTVLVIIGYFILGWEIHVLLKWLVIFSSSFVVIVAMYVILIRNFDLLRFLFGMKTTGPIYAFFRKTGVLILFLLVWVGLTAFAVINGEPNTGQNRLPVSMTYQPGKDIVLNAGSISKQSQAGVQVVSDIEASIGRAIEFSSVTGKQIEVDPNVYVDMRFSAPAGRYFLWLRGKSDVESELTDSIWLQVDNQVGTAMGSVHLGNWNSFQPIGVYTWAGDVNIPYIVELKHSGEHIIRIQVRQAPHRIDQIWLSRSQLQIPDTNQPVH